MLKRNIQQTLRESVIDPKKDTAYRFVVDLNSSAYCVTKALDTLNTIDIAKVSKKAADDSIKQAITLLAMARVINGCSDTRKADLPS